jgi:hypothetical protein
MQKCNNIWWEKWVGLRPVLLRPQQTAGVVISPHVGPITAVTIIAGKDVQMVLWRGNDWAVLLCLTTWYSEISNTIMTTQKTGSNELAIKSEGFKSVPCLKKGLFIKMTAFWYRLTFQRCILPPSSLWWWRQTTWYYIPEGCHLHTDYHENPISHKFISDNSTFIFVYWWQRSMWLNTGVVWWTVTNSLLDAYTNVWYMVNSSSLNQCTFGSTITE